jgi:hypothetical protein
MAPEQYVALARRAIVELLDREHAAPWLEVEARITDVPWPTIGHRIDKHHLSTAHVQLLRAGHIEQRQTDTRGGREVTIIQPADVGRRATAIAKAAQRKRVLLARYLGWAQGTRTRPGIIGPAAERVVHESLKETATFRLINPAGGQVSEFLGCDIKGPLDNAIILAPMSDDGLPGQPIAVPIEVKNIRDWIYPSSQELYQLLEKAARLKQLQPQIPLVPLLVCRRAHYTAFKMAKALGFFIVETRRQYIGPVEEERLEEVRVELGFLDLMALRAPDPPLVHMFRDVFTKQASASADNWAITAEDTDICGAFPLMWHDPNALSRGRTLDLVRAFAERAGLDGGW